MFLIRKSNYLVEFCNLDLMELNINKENFKCWLKV